MFCLVYNKLLVLLIEPRFVTYLIGVMQALVSSWKRGDTMSFIFDTLWDLIKLADYLTQREDIDPFRIGITVEPLGGMHAWFAAAAVTCYAVVVPIIGVRGLDGLSIMTSGKLKLTFEEARIELGKSFIERGVVEKVWDRIAPGLASQLI